MPAPAVRSLLPGLLLAAVWFGGCRAEDTPLLAEVTYTEERAPCADRNPTRHLYFGDLHYHTRLSWDAYGYELTVTPAEAYSFARGGGAVRLPPLGADGRGTREVRLDRPLDFAAGSDHGEFYGELHTCLTPGLPGHDSVACQSFRALGEGPVANWGVQMAHPDGSPRRAEICGADGAACRSAARTVWEQVRAAAEAANDRTASCSFAAFVAYEYTASPLVTNQHRNVIFRNGKLPELPTTYFEQPHAPGLWREMARQCLDAGTGCEVMVIPHNSNWSNGTLFSPSYLAEQARLAGMEPAEAVALRARLEATVVEIAQHKGDMECAPGLSTWSGDPHCSFEKIRFAPFEDCGEATGTGGVKDVGCISRLDFLRAVLQRGLVDEQRTGANPYRLGVIGSTDSHNGTPGNTEEQGWPGHVGVADDTAEERLGPGNTTHRGLVNNPGGLAAVWSVERSRDAIWEALRRRETFSTSGTRMAVRFFGGWDFAADLCDQPDRIEKGYRGGVPMGGLLPPAPAGGRPVFLIEAQADPGTSSKPGTPLQQVQVIKSWLDAGGQPREQVYLVAGQPGDGASLDPSTCQQRAAGASRLCARWTDPAFDPGQRAFYYVRVLENPSCRWSTRECNALPIEQRPEGCNDPNVQKVIQERAITSAIWYTP